MNNISSLYELIKKTSQDETYFCFEKAIKEGWTDLVNNYTNIKEAEVEFEEKEQNLRLIKK